MNGHYVNHGSYLQLQNTLSLSLQKLSYFVFSFNHFYTHPLSIYNLHTGQRYLNASVLPGKGTHTESESENVKIIPSFSIRTENMLFKLLLNIKWAFNKHKLFKAFNSQWQWISHSWTVWVQRHEYENNITSMRTTSRVLGQHHTYGNKITSMRTSEIWEHNYCSMRTTSQIWEQHN